MTQHLPDGSILSYGVATAAYQIEGATAEDGRGASVWDTFAATPGATRDGRDGTVACDSYHRYAEDLDLVAGLGAEWYRFSVAWPRIVPAGTGRVETRGLDYYDRLVDAALARGVAPTATLYHWDLPQALEDRDGWLEPRHGGGLRRLRDGRPRPARRPGPGLGHPQRAVVRGLPRLLRRRPRPRPQGGRRRPPGRPPPQPRPRAGRGPPARGRRHRRRHRAQPGAVLARDARRRRQAADELDAIRNRVWLGPLVDGAYDEGLLRVAPELADPALVRDGDLALVRGSADWIGVNYYTPFRPTLADPSLERHPEVEAYPGVTPVSFVVREPRTDIGWEVDATGLEELLVDTHKRTGLPLLVTENGAAYPDTSARSTTRTGSATCATTSPPPSGLAPPAPTSGPTSSGRCWTTSSGPRATPRPSGSCTSIPGTRPGRPRRPTTGWRSTSPPVRVPRADG